MDKDKEDISLDAILGIICPKTHNWVSRGYKCFGKYNIRGRDWKCNTFLEVGMDGCKACKEWCLLGKVK